MSMTKKIQKCLDGRVEALKVVALLALLMVAVLVASNAVAAVPTDITLSPSKIMSTTDTSAGTVIGSLSTTDADGGDTFTYSIVAGGADNSVFAVVGGNDLELTDGVIDIALPTDANADGVYEVMVRTTDSTLNTFDELLLVNIVPVYNPLVHSSLSTDSTRWSGDGGWGIAGSKYGEFTCSTCHARNTGNIKRVNATFAAPNGIDQFPIEAGAGSVSFQDAREGSSDFGDDSRADKTQSSNVCEACHTYDAAKTDGVEFHGYNMTVAGDPAHYNQADCTTCHQHKEGFKPKACDSCHGYPPTDISAGGPTGLANVPFTTASATAGAHQKHALDLGYACTNCHDGYVMPDESAVKTGFGDISIGFNNFGSTTGSYTGQANVSYNDVLGTGGENCSNIYCHSTGQSADGTSNVPSAYATPSWSTPLSGACGTCHSDTDPGTGSHNVHIVTEGAVCNDCHSGNNHVDRVIDVTSGTYTAGGAPGNNYGTCSTASCHDQGRGGLATTPTWGVGTTDCTECHEGAGMATGGHTIHLAASIAGTAITCSDCHDAATDPATETAPAVGHRDTNIDVTAGSYPVDKAKDSAFVNCTTAACHRSGIDPVAANDYTVTSNWDIDNANCTQCHAAVPATGSHATHVTTAGYDCSQCHTGATKDTSYAAAAHGDSNIDVAVGNYIVNRTNQTYGTAFTSCDTISCHGDGLNAGGGNTPVWGVAAGCTACHDTVTDGTGSHAIHLTYTSNACIACHDNADVAGTASGQHGDGDVDVFDTAAGDLGYPQDAAIGNLSWSGCTAASCHDDGRSANTTPNWGTAAGDACAACHDAIPATGSHASHVADAAVACTDCHSGAVESTTKPTAGHDDGNIDTTVGHGYTQDKLKGSAFETCATASCHNDGRNSGLTGAWGTPLNNCSECHATQPATFAHNTHLTSTITATISCGNCHNDAVEGTTSPTGDHRDGNVDVYNSVAGDLGYTVNKGLGTATVTCATSYCHGDNMPAGTTSGTTNAPNWNASTTACTFCHDMAPAAIGAHTGKLLTDCITCHGVGAGDVNAAGTGFTNAGATHIDGTVQVNADSCTSCHAADIDGGLSGVHNSHTDTAAFLAGKTVSGNNYGDANWYTTTYVNGKPNFACGQCHPDAEGVSHPINGLNVDIAQKAATNIKEKNNAVVGLTITSRTTVTCSSVYCHSDGQAAPTYGSSPDWYGGTVSANCNDCHNNGPASGTHANHLVGIHYETLYSGSAGLMANSGIAGSGAAHGDAATADTIGCQSCHNTTVKVEFNDQNSLCVTCHDNVTAPFQGNMTIDTAGSTHVNGLPDVVFADFSTFKSKAQIRDDITTVAEVNTYWTRTNGYKAANSFDQGKAAVPGYAADSCSNIACHNGIATPTWSGGFNGDCRACHTQLP